MLHGGADVPLWQRLVSFLGLGVMIAIAWGLSSDRRAFPWRIVLYGTALQLVFGAFVLKTAVGMWLFSTLNGGVVRLLDFTNEGSRFVFGPYLDREFTVAMSVLPTIIFFSTLMTVLYHLGIMQRVVKGVAFVMQRTLRTSGAETLSAAANIFVGQTEAPLVVRPFVPTMTRSELMAVMVGGFATVAGGVLAAYVGMLRARFPDIAGHLLAASVMSAPAALVIAKVMVPERERPQTAGTLEMPNDNLYANVIDAAAAGALEGLKLALNVGALLIAFIALVAMLNFLVGLPAHIYNSAVWEGLRAQLEARQVAVPEGCGAPSDAAALASCIRQAGELASISVTWWEPLTLQRILGTLFWPIAFVLGVPPADCSEVAAMLGEKTVLNEFVAYVHLAENLSSENPISPRAATITSYALCGFANFGSIAIQIGGIGALAPERRSELAQLGLRAMIGGGLACNMTACIAGILT